MTDKTDFQKLVEEKVIPFMREHKLVKGTLSDGVAETATIKRDKHGFYSVKFTNKKEQL